MRSTRRSKSEKKAYAQRNIKKKHRNKSRGIFSWSDDMSGLFLDDLNEILRENKARRAECNGSWKVLPKDSCEVYKNRRKRSETNRRNQQNAAESTYYDTDSRIEECRRDRRERRNTRRRQQRRKLPTRRVSVKDKRRRRSHRSESSFSNSSSSVTTTDTSVSEMDY